MFVFFDDTQLLTVPHSPLGSSEFSKTQKKFPEMNPVTGYGRILKVSVNWIEGVTEFLLLLLRLFFLFFFSTSPFGIPNGFGEDIVSPIQIHDPVLQVEFPFVLTSVNLGSQEEEMNGVGVEDRWTPFHFTVDTVSNVFSPCTQKTQPDTYLC